MSSTSSFSIDLQFNKIAVRTFASLSIVIEVVEGRNQSWESVVRTSRFIPHRTIRDESDLMIRFHKSTSTVYCSN